MGKTWPDLISEYPKTFLFLLLSIVSILICSAYFLGLTVKVGSAEISANKQSSVKDTSRTPVISKEESVKSIDKPQKTITRKTDTLNTFKNKNEIKNSPKSNINTGGGNQTVINDNHGIIGDNNNINLSSDKWELSVADKSYLLNLIDTLYKSHSKEKNFFIWVYTFSDKNSVEMGHQVTNFLQQNGYKTNKQLGTVSFSPFYGLQYNFFPNYLQLIIGYKKP